MELSVKTCPICYDRIAMIAQACCHNAVCVPCHRIIYDDASSKCPFCRAEEPYQVEPDLIHIKRRKVNDQDKEWRPTSTVRVVPRSSVRQTRRTVYIYDYESDEDEVSVEDIGFPPVNPPSFIPPPPTTVDLTCDESSDGAFTDVDPYPAFGPREQGVEESKEEEGVEESKESEERAGPCVRCRGNTIRVSACCALYYCWTCWFNDLHNQGTYNIAMDKYVRCPQCSGLVHIDGKRLFGGQWV